MERQLEDICCYKAMSWNTFSCLQTQEVNLLVEPISVFSSFM